MKKKKIKIKNKKNRNRNKYLLDKSKKDFWCKKFEK
jgi:hypothetical protein